MNEIELNEKLISPFLKKNNEKGIVSKILRNPFSTNKSKTEPEPAPSQEKIDTKKTYLLSTINGKSNYTLGDCCSPIPGDDVVGYICDDNQVMVHKLNCQRAMRLKSSYGGRLVATKWDKSKEKFLAKIRIEGIDRMGILQEIIQIISTTLSINIRELNIGADNGVFRSILIIMVEDTKVVTSLCQKLKKVKGVKTATRVND